MKRFLPLFYLVGLAGLAPAAPYIVYSGSTAGTSFSPAGQAKSASTIYLVTDLADSSSFAILEVDPVSKAFTVVARPTANPVDTEAPNNFFGGIVTSNRAGLGVLRFSGASTDANGNTFVANAYGTGPLTMASTNLVPARRTPLVVNLKLNGTPGSYTFNTLSPVITSAGFTYPKSITGVITSHQVASGGLARMSLSGTFTLAPNLTLTSLANIGGAYASGKNTAAILPIKILTSESAADAYSAWLSAFAQVSGFAGPMGTQGVAGALPFGTDVSPGAALLPGNLSFPPTVTTTESSTGTTTLTVTAGTGTAIAFGGGTLKLTTGSSASVLVQPAIGSGFSGILAIESTPAPPGGNTLGYVPGTALTTLSHVDTGNPGAVLSFTFSGSSLPGLLGSGVYYLGTGPFVMVTLSFPTFPTDLLGQWSFVEIGGGSMTFTSVQNGLASGTITIPLGSTCAFSDVTLLLHGENIGAAIAPGDTVSGSIKVNAGTFVEQASNAFTATSNTFNLTP